MMLRRPGGQATVGSQAQAGDSHTLIVVFLRPAPSLPALGVCAEAGEPLDVVLGQLASQDRRFRATGRPRGGAVGGRCQ